MNIRDYLHADTDLEGLDSIDTCIAEGYLMVEYSEHEEFTPERFYRLLRTLPEWVDQNRDEPFVLDSMWNWEQLMNIYNENKESLDNFSDDLPEVVKEPSLDNLLRLADSIDGYFSLNNY